MEKKRGRPKKPNAIRYLPRVIVSIPPQTKEAVAYLCERQNYSPSDLFQAALIAYVQRLPRKHRVHVAALLKGVESEDPGLTQVDVPLKAKPAIEAFLGLWVKPKDTYEEAARRFFRDFFQIAEE